MILNVLLEEYEIRCQKMNIRLSVDTLVGVGEWTAAEEMLGELDKRIGKE